jgi:hypothetical protein
MDHSVLSNTIRLSTTIALAGGIVLLVVAAKKVMFWTPSDSFAEDEGL